MQFEIELKLKSFCVEDLDEIEEEILSLLYKKYVVKKSKRRRNTDQPGVHCYFVLKNMPMSVLSGLGNSGREE